MRVKAFKDRRLLPVLYTAIYARRLAFREPGEKELTEYIPEKLRNIDYIRDNIEHLLIFFGIKQKGEDGNYIIKLCPPVTFARRINILNILFWKVTSLWYPNGRPIAKAKDDLISMLEFLLDQDIEYENLLHTLIATGYFRSEQQNEGALKLIVPSVPDSSAIIVKGSSPSGLQLHVVSKYDLIRSSDAPLVQFFCEKSDAENFPQYMNWDVLKMDTAERKTFRKDEEWESLGIKTHPDIIGFRYNQGDENNISSGLVLAMEISSMLDDDLVDKLISFLTFSNVVYLSLVRSRINPSDRRIQKLREAGVGVLCLKSIQDLNSWYESIPPVIHMQSEEAKDNALRCFFSENELTNLLLEHAAG